MAGLNATTARPLSETEDIAQSIGVILTTPIGTRVMRRPFGSYLFDLVDCPGTAAGALRVIAAAADAIERWEPRVTFVSGIVAIFADGRATLTAQCRLRADDRALDISIALGAAA